MAQAAAWQGAAGRSVANVLCVVAGTGLHLGCTPLRGTAWVPACQQAASPACTVQVPWAGRATSPGAWCWQLRPAAEEPPVSHPCSPAPHTHAAARCTQARARPRRTTRAPMHVRDGSPPRAASASARARRPWQRQSPDLCPSVGTTAPPPSHPAPASRATQRQRWPLGASALPQPIRAACTADAERVAALDVPRGFQIALYLPAPVPSARGMTVSGASATTGPIITYIGSRNARTVRAPPGRPMVCLPGPSYRVPPGPHPTCHFNACCVTA